MKIDFWDCKYSDADEMEDESGWCGWIYWCNHPDNKTGRCILEPYSQDEEGICNIAEKEE